MFVQEYQKLLDAVKNEQDQNKKKILLSQITEELSKGELMYAFPYQMKLLIIDYAKQVQSLHNA